MKGKIVGICLISILIFTVNSSVFASINDEDTILQSQIDAMLDQAIEMGQEPVTQGLLISDEGEEFLVDVYELDTTSITRTASGEGSVTYAADLRATGSKTENIWDTTGSVKLTMTLSYTTRTNSSGPSEILLTKVNGSYAIDDPYVTVTGQKVKYTCVNTYLSSNQKTNKVPTSATWSYNTGYSTYVPNGDPAVVYGGYRVQLKHQSGSTWVFFFHNMIHGAEPAAWADF